MIDAIFAFPASATSLHEEAICSRLSDGMFHNAAGRQVLMIKCRLIWVFLYWYLQPGYIAISHWWQQTNSMEIYFFFQVRLNGYFNNAASDIFCRRHFQRKAIISVSLVDCTKIEFSAARRVCCWWPIADISLLLSHADSIDCFRKIAFLRRSAES